MLIMMTVWCFEGRVGGWVLHKWHTWKCQLCCQCIFHLIVKHLSITNAWYYWIWKCKKGMFRVGGWVNICFLFWLPVVPVSLHWYTLVQLSSGFCIFKFGAGKNLTKCGLLSELYCEWGWPGQPQILKSPYPEFASRYLKPTLSIC